MGWTEAAFRSSGVVGVFCRRSVTLVVRRSASGRRGFRAAVAGAVAAWRIGFDEKMRLEGRYRYLHAFLCVLGAMGAGRVFFPDGPIGFLVAYLLVSFMAIYGVAFVIALWILKRRRAILPKP